VRNLDEIDRLLEETEGELAKLNTRRAEMLAQITALQQEKAALLQMPEAPLQLASLPSVTNQSSQEAKIALFRSLFRGREDVYPKRFESLKTGKKGYQPVCRNEWVSGICEKPKIRCDDCAHRQLLPVTDDVVRNHLLGMDPQASSGRDFTIGVYPMLPDETCWFLATDLTKLLGNKMRGRSWRRASFSMYRQRWRDRVRGMAVTPGYSFPSLSQRCWHVKWGPSF
jgi:hypothetical protein